LKEDKLKAIKSVLKTGSEALTFEGDETKYSLLNFWQWSVSDILSNATRGRFAEFIVGTAIDLDLNQLRDEWDAYDLITKSGIKIEIKSASYIQSWRQFDYSIICFSIRPSKHRDSENVMSRGESKRHADLYVFCLLKHKEQETIDPLKLEQWDFFVVPTYKLDNYTRSKSSITLNSLLRITDKISYIKLKDEIDKVYKEQIDYKEQKTSCNT
jgi:hypothetical protein